MYFKCATYGFEIPLLSPSYNQQQLQKKYLMMMGAVLFTITDDLSSHMLLARHTCMYVVMYSCLHKKISLQHLRVEEFRQRTLIHESSPSPFINPDNYETMNHTCFTLHDCNINLCNKIHIYFISLIYEISSLLSNTFDVLVSRACKPTMMTRH